MPEAADPALQPVGKRQIGVQLPRDIAADVEAQIPGLGGIRTVGLRTRSAQGTCIGIARAGFKVVQDGEQLRRTHLLVLLYLEIEVVLKALCSGEGVALLHNIQESRCRAPSAPASASHRQNFCAQLRIAVGRHIGGESTECGFLDSARFVRVLQHQLTAFGKQLRIPSQSARASVGAPLRCRRCCSQTGLASLSSRGEAMQSQRRRPVARQAGQRIPRTSARRDRVGNEILVAFFGAGETSVIAGDRHIGVPEQVFFGFVDGEVFGVEAGQTVRGRLSSWSVLSWCACRVGAIFPPFATLQIAQTAQADGRQRHRRVDRMHATGRITGAHHVCDGQFRAAQDRGLHTAPCQRQ